MKLLKSMTSVTNIYNKFSSVGKVLFFASLLLILVVLFKHLFALKRRSEGFDNNNLIINNQNEKYVFKDGINMYDDFYSKIYDYLVFSNVKNDYEINAIIKKTHPNPKNSIIVDIGCGTGHHVGALRDKNINIMGVDISPAMIKAAKTAYPNCEFQVGDALNTHLLGFNSTTHILCLYFTIYFFSSDGKRVFFQNCMDWLIPGGFLIVHLVDREKFDPILPPGNPLYIVSPQKYAKERITHTKVTFNEFQYESDFKLEPENDVAVFEEKFKFNNGNTRKHEQTLYMENTSEIIDMAQNAGFIIHAKIDLLKCAYENQFLYIFMKPG
jgi:SAM-dependent methyltransferase